MVVASHFVSGRRRHDHTAALVYARQRMDDNRATRIGIRVDRRRYHIRRMGRQWYG